MKLYLPDNDLCPSCNEHQGEPEKEACEECLDGEEWERKMVGGTVCQLSQRELYSKQ